MSSVGRTANRGGKGIKPDTGYTPKAQKPEIKSEPLKTPDVVSKIQPTPEQMRIAQMIDTTKREDPEITNKIKQVVDFTEKTEDEVATVLHDCDFDTTKAIEMLLEGQGLGEWELTTKKKKNRQQQMATKSADTNHIDNKENEPTDRSREREPGLDRERSRNRGPPRMRGRGGSSDNRGWRGRESRENERNLEDSRDGRGRGGRMANGPGRFPRGSRGRGPRTFQSRKEGAGFPRSIDIWNNSQAENVGDTLKVDNWGDDFPTAEDWDNEEYTGSLAETKVYTPSTSTSTSVTVPQSAPEPLEDTTSQSMSPNLTPNQSLSSTITTAPLSQGIDFSALLQKPTGQPTQNSVMVGPMTSSQQQFLSQFTQQATENLKSVVGVGCATTNSSPGTSYTPPTVNSYPVSCTAYQAPSFSDTAVSSYSTSSFSNSTSSFGSQIKPPSAVQVVTHPSSNQALPGRTKPTHRARVPPPSKIPSSAVEMPDDAITSLEVQFEGLEFGSETSTFDFTNDQSKFSTSNDNTSTSFTLSGNSAKPSTLDSYTSNTGQQSNKDLSQSSLTGALSQSQKRSGTTGATLDLGKGDPTLGGFSSSSPSSYASSYQSQKPTSSAYQTGSSYSQQSAYGASQASASPAFPSVQSTTNYPSQNSSYSSSQSGNSYASQNASSFQSSQTSSSYPTTQSATSFVTSQAGNSYQSNQSASSYPTGSQSAYQPGSSFTPVSQSGSGYQGSSQSGSGYQGSSQSGSSYQNASQSPYGGSCLSQTGSSGYNASAGTSQYQNSYGSSTATTTQSHSSVVVPISSNKLSGSLGSSVKDGQHYDTTTATSSSLTNTLTTTSSQLTNVSVTMSLGLSASNSSTATSTSSMKFASSTSKASGLPNLPPGVPAVMGTHQYIMGQAGMPFYAGLAQQPLYSYEDLQLLQQRFPHLTTGYYDMGFQAPTSLATGREASLANVAYSVSDGKAGYARTDNSSPVPSTLSQQSASQTHQPFINAAAATFPPGYAYIYGGGMVPGSFQYGTTAAIYQMATPANTHGATTNTQFQKLGGYGSGYSSGYESLAQTQDYKSLYGTSQSQKGSVGTSGSSGTSASDLGASVYGKTQTLLKTSFEKGFHPGTPPPTYLAGTQTTPMGAPSGTYAPQMFIPAMAPHQQHHSPLLHPSLHQDSGTVSGQRSQSSVQQNKPGNKPTYGNSYWPAN